MFAKQLNRHIFGVPIKDLTIFDQYFCRYHGQKDDVCNFTEFSPSSALPRLVTRYGKLEDEMKEYEKELKREKSREEEFERKLREMRKVRNKARLRNERNLNPPSKRQKTEEDRFVSIRTTWGAPETTAPRKNIKEPERQKDTRKRQRIEKENEKEILTNARRVEDKVMEGETITDLR